MLPPGAVISGLSLESVPRGPRELNALRMSLAPGSLKGTLPWYSAVKTTSTGSVASTAFSASPIGLGML